MSRVLAIGDTQEPFSHQDYLDFCIALWNYFDLDTAIHVGDEVDFHCYGRYPKDPAGYSAVEEVKRAIDKLEWWYGSFPKMKVCWSNHTARYHKKLFEAGIPAQHHLPIEELLDAPKGWEWADYWEIDGVLYEHGHELHRTSPMKSAAVHRRQSVVWGHHHGKAGVEWSRSRDQRIFSMGVGCGVDDSAYAFRYAGKHVTSLHGAGVVINGKNALWVPMEVDKRGRWTGDLNL